MKKPPPVNDSLLRQRLAEIEAARDWPAGVLPGLERLVRTAEDYDLFRVDAVRYAAAHGLDEAVSIALFVHAAKVGLFEMDWLLLCAYCPQVAGSFRELDQLHPRFRCAFCNALNDVALDDYIQVAFTISGSVRDIAFHHPETLPIEDYYLRFNFSKGFIPPHGMTHQQLVAALSRGFADIEGGGSRSFDFEIAPGRFEVLDLSHKLLLVFFVDGVPAERQALRVRLEPGRFEVPGRATGPRDMVLGHGRFSFRQAVDLGPGRHAVEVSNRTGERGRFWFLQYPPGFVPEPVEYEPFLSGKRLLLTPCFGDLFKTQLVDEHESLTVSDMTYLFTDLKDSTPLYESVGDVNAYFLVRQHFDILDRIIRDRSGTIVKTIGDAVMAGFERPSDAVSAAVEMIEELARFNRTASRSLGLKIGIHRGRAIAVRLNDRIDYFGQEVNIAARVQAAAKVGEICITQAVIEAAGVGEIVGNRPVSRDFENLKGIGQKMEIHRLAVVAAQ